MRGISSNESRDRLSSDRRWAHWKSINFSRRSVDGFFFRIVSFHSLAERWHTKARYFSAERKNVSRLRKYHAHLHSSFTRATGEKRSNISFISRAEVYCQKNMERSKAEIQGIAKHAENTNQDVPVMGKRLVFKTFHSNLAIVEHNTQTSAPAWSSYFDVEWRVGEAEEERKM